MGAEERVYLNVGGHRFLTRWATLKYGDCSRLSRLSTIESNYDPITNEFYFDRSASLFECILDLHRTGALHIPHDVCIPRIRAELQFWEIPLDKISCCCWARVQENDKMLLEVHQLRNTFRTEYLDGLGRNPDADRAFPENPKSPVCRQRPGGEKKTNWCRRAANSIWMLLDHPQSSYAAMAYTLIYLACTGLSIFVLCAESLPHNWEKKEIDDLQPGNYNSVHHGDTNTTAQEELPQRLRSGIVLIELVTNIFFTLDGLLGLLCCPHTKLLVCSVRFWINLISVTASWVVLRAGHVQANVCPPLYLKVFTVLRSLRTWRVNRVFYLVRGWEVLLFTLRQSLWEIGILGIIFLTGMVVCATLIYYAERPNPDNFPNIHTGFWWAIVTMTTVGYGDIYPTTAYGYAIGSVCAVTGMFVAALPIAIISENFRRARGTLQLVEGFYKRNKQTIPNKYKEDGMLECPVCRTRSFKSST